MSYVTHIAAARPLPTGNWQTPPLRVYSSYEEYGRSPDFQRVWEMNPSSRCRTPEEKLEFYRRNKGRVEIYESRPNFITVETFEPFEFSQGKWISREGLRTHLTLPELYWCNSWDYSLEQYLCWALRPGEEAEVLTCWNGEESQPLAGPVQEVDLQVFADGGRIQYDVVNGNSLVRYRAPREPQPMPMVAWEKEKSLAMIAWEKEKPLAMVWLDIGREFRVI